MKRILCYGDSNTHGTKPMQDQNDVARFSKSERWPCLTAASLGVGFEIIEEGLPGRTTVHDDAIEGAHKNGKTYLLPCLESHWPLDAVVIALGVNDLKARYGVQPSDIAASVGVLIDVIKTASCFGGKPPKILVLASPPITETGWLADMFAGGAEKSLGLSKALATMAASRGVAFFDAGTVAKVSPIDGIHFDAANHQAIGQAVALHLKDILA
jgi:lysophospholipase L1-like esterase